MAHTNRGRFAALLLRQPTRFLEDAHKHRSRQLSRLRVLVRWMIGRQQAAPVRRFIACAMLKDISLLSLKLPFALQGIQISIEPDLPQRHDHLAVFQSRKFGVEVRCAVPEFLGKGLIVRWSTAYGGGDVEIAKHESVVAVRGVGLTRKA